MSETLALKYRPQTFEDLVGQNAIQVILRQMVKMNQVPNALLFDGSRGTGKTTTARILAAALNCEDPPGPCGCCVGCKAVFSGNSLSVREIDGASHGLVDDIRRLNEELRYDFGGKTIIILDEVHSVSTAGFNALLKTIEEPPPETYFVLLTTEPHRVLDTVRSRCMEFTFRRITVDAISQRLQHICEQEQQQAEPEMLRLIAERADGAMRDAIMELDLCVRSGIRTVPAYQHYTGDGDIGAQLMESLSVGDIATAHQHIDDALTTIAEPITIINKLSGALRDVLVLSAGGSVSQQGEMLALRKRLANQITVVRLVGALRTIWDLKTKIRAGQHDRSTIDLAVIMISEALKPTTAVAAPESVAEPAKRLTLDEMRARRG